MPTTAVFQTQFRTVDGVEIRYAQSDGAHDPTVLLTSPWPESVYAFASMWSSLTEHARLFAIDLPGFGASERRDDLLSPRAMGGFLARLIDEAGLGTPHIVGPDVGTAAALFAAAEHPERIASVIVGTGGTAVPLQLGEPLRSWVLDPDFDKYRRIDPRAIVNVAVDTIAGGVPDDIRADYLDCYDGDRFAESMRYVRRYPEELPQLAELLPQITTPVTIINGRHDPVVPLANAEFLDERLPDSRLAIIDAGHFVWEERRRSTQRSSSGRSPRDRMPSAHVAARRPADGRSAASVVDSQRRPSRPRIADASALHNGDGGDRLDFSGFVTQPRTFVAAGIGRACDNEVLAAHEREPGDRAEEGEDRGDHEDLVQRAREAGVERVDEVLALCRRHGAQDAAHLSGGQRRGEVAADARGRAERVDRLGRDRVLEDRPERRNARRDADLAERAPDPRGHAAALRRHDANLRRGQRRVDHADAEAGEDEAGEEVRPLRVGVQAGLEDQTDADEQHPQAEQD